MCDWLRNHWGVDNFVLSKHFFTLVLLLLYVEFVFSASHLPQSLPHLGLILVLCFVMWALSITADHGARLDFGKVKYVEVPFRPGYLELDFIRPYAVILVGIATVSFFGALLDWKFSASFAAGVPKPVFQSGANLAEAVFSVIGIFFLSCEKRRRKFTNYTVFAH